MKIPIAILLAAACLVESSCENASAVGQFASASAQALAQGPAVLSDLLDSCVREHTETDPREGFNPPNTDAIGMECQEYGGQVAVLLNDSQALTAYFTAIAQVAAVGSSTAGPVAPAVSAASVRDAPEGTGGSASPSQLAAPLLSFLDQLATSGYRSKHLDKDVKDQHDNVNNLLTALSRAVTSAYYARLRNEQDGIERFFSRLTEGSNAPALPVRVLIRDRRDEHMSLIAARKRKAETYVAALQQIQAGNDKLKSAAHIEAKDMPAVLQPYTSALGQLIPALMH